VTRSGGPTPPVSRDVVEGSAWSMTQRANAFSNAAMPTVRGCVNDFDTAKSRCGVHACLQPDQTQDDPKLLHLFQ